jgi:hypothetical protein
VCALSFPSFSVCTELSFPSLLTVARAQSEEDAATAEVVEGADLGIVGDDTQVSSDEPLSPAPGVETLCVFPKNAGKSEYISKYLYVIYLIVHHVSEFITDDKFQTEQIHCLSDTIPCISAACGVPLIFTQAILLKSYILTIIQ